MQAPEILAALAVPVVLATAPKAALTAVWEGLAPATMLLATKATSEPPAGQRAARESAKPLNGRLPDMKTPGAFQAIRINQNNGRGGGSQQLVL
jgi:hypothetical protein